MRPRGLWIECGDDLKEEIEEEVGLCFRKVLTLKEERVSFKAVLGSTLVVRQVGETASWKRNVLKGMSCWLEAASGEEVIQFLVERNARYLNWK